MQNAALRVAVESRLLAGLAERPLESPSLDQLACRQASNSVSTGGFHPVNGNTEVGEKPTQDHKDLEQNMLDPDLVGKRDLPYP